MIRFEFDGSICVSSAHEQDSKVEDILVLGKMDKKYPINSKLPQFKGKPSTTFKESVELKFYHKKSIDVIISALIKIRKNLNT